MKVTVDLKKCERHGQCVIAAPDVFDLRQGEDLRWAEHPDDGLRQDVEDAMDACPVQAITIED
jgi:ferredoxin